MIPYVKLAQKHLRNSHNQAKLYDKIARKNFSWEVKEMSEKTAKNKVFCGGAKNSGWCGEWTHKQNR